MHAIWSARHYLDQATAVKSWIVLVRRGTYLDVENIQCRLWLKDMAKRAVVG